MSGVPTVTRGMLTQFLHSLADELDDGTVTLEQFGVESQPGAQISEARTLLTGRRRLQIVWFDERVRHVIQ